ncbi:MAG: glycerophosphodiester phosphodiesterase [Bacteroidales bacterium]|nr:glycerophosphodiester phosphodiesterase [Bacteroidales bacterium]
MNKVILLLLATLLAPLAGQAQQPSEWEKGTAGVVAHRGFHKYADAAENSIAAMQIAVDHDFYGTEFDVQFTLDSVAIVFHDPSIKEMPIAKTPYKELSGYVLSNGEKLPTLDQFLQAYADAIEKQKVRNKHTRLIFEIKPVDNRAMVDYVAAEVLKAVDKYNLRDAVDFISFDMDVCMSLVRADRTLSVAYLGSDMMPRHLHARGIRGIDYHYEQLLKNPQWIEEAHKLGMTVNAWTVNDQEVARKLRGLQVDLLTTDLPLDMQSLVEENR